MRPRTALLHWDEAWRRALSRQRFAALRIRHKKQQEATTTAAVREGRPRLPRLAVPSMQQCQADYWALFDDIERRPARRPSPWPPASRALRRQLARPLPVRRRLPHRRLRQPHRLPALPRRALRRIRHSNFIERTFGETRRRVKVIGRLPGERSCLGLVWAVLDRASRAGAASPTRPPSATSKTYAASCSSHRPRFPLTRSPNPTLAAA